MYRITVISNLEGKDWTAVVQLVTGSKSKRKQTINIWWANYLIQLTNRCVSWWSAEVHFRGQWHSSFRPIQFSSVHIFISRTQQIYNLIKNKVHDLIYRWQHEYYRLRYQEESPGCKTNKGDPPFLFSQNIRNGIDEVFLEWNKVKLRISIKTFSNSGYKII